MLTHLQALCCLLLVLFLLKLFAFAAQDLEAGELIGGHVVESDCQANADCGIEFGHPREKVAVGADVQLLNLRKRAVRTPFDIAR